MSNSKLFVDIENFSVELLGFSPEIDCKALTKFLDADVDLERGPDESQYKNVLFFKNYLFLEFDVESER